MTLPYSVQGGYKNYHPKPGKVRNVELPENWQSGPGEPTTHPAFITEEEQDILRMFNVHGKDNPEDIGRGFGPGGLPSYDGFGDRDGASDYDNTAGEAEAGSTTGPSSSNTPGRPTPGLNYGSGYSVPGVDLPSYDPATKGFTDYGSNLAKMQRDLNNRQIAMGQKPTLMMMSGMPGVPATDQYGQAIGSETSADRYGENELGQFVGYSSPTIADFYATPSDQVTTPLRDEKVEESQIDKKVQDLFDKSTKEDLDQMMALSKRTSNRQVRDEENVIENMLTNPGDFYSDPNSGITINQIDSPSIADFFGGQPTYSSPNIQNPISPKDYFSQMPSTQRALAETEDLGSKAASMFGFQSPLSWNPETQELEESTSFDINDAPAINAVLGMINPALGGLKGLVDSYAKNDPMKALTSILGGLSASGSTMAELLALNSASNALGGPSLEDLDFPDTDSVTNFNPSDFYNDAVSLFSSPEAPTTETLMGGSGDDMLGDSPYASISQPTISSLENLNYSPINFSISGDQLAQENPYWYGGKSFFDPSEDIDIGENYGLA